MLCLKNICKNFKQGDHEIRVLKKLNLNLKENNLVGLIGPSGSGKTTLLNIIGLLDNFSTGILEINNVNIGKLDLDQKNNFRKKSIGFIFQNNQLLEDFSCEENIAFPLILNGTSYKKAIMESNNLLQEFNLDHRSKFKPSLLSGGEQQRVSVLRSLIKKPKILLVDEPTGSLDNENSILVMNYIKKLSRKHKTLTIIATHNLSLVSMLDNCFEISEGKLVEYPRKK